MKVCLQRVFFLLLTVLLPWPAVADAGEASEKFNTMVQTMDEDIRELKLLTAQIKQGDTYDIEALYYRQDKRSFQLLSDLDALVRQAAGLSEGSVEREKAELLLTLDLETIGDAIFKRLDELEKRITAGNKELDSLGGSARISGKVYMHSLESIRFHYYDALISHFDSRRTLGLSSEKLRERLKPVLYIHAEKLAGQVEFASSTREGLSSQLDIDPENTEISATIRNLSFQHKIYVSRLELAIELLERLALDSTEYKAVLLTDSGGFSVDLLDAGVLKSVTAEWVATIRDAAITNSPDVLLNLILFIVIILVFRFLSRLTKRMVERSCESSSLDLSTLLKDILISGSGGVVMVLGVFMALSQIGISLGPMLAGLGVAGFVVGFALQDTLGNFAAGGMILMYRPYDVDDFIEVAGASGLVKKMNLVSTTITTFDNQTLVVPNSKIWGDVIKNVTAQKVRRVDLEFGIGYSDDVEHAERVLDDIVSGHEMVLKKPATMIKLHTLGESSVNFIVRPWVKTENYWDVYWDITREVKLRFDREGISIPFPQRDVHLYSQTGGASD